MPVTAPTLLTSFLTGTVVNYTGKFAAINLGIILDGIDASAFCYHIELAQAKDLIDVTLLGDTWKRYDPDRERLNVALSLFQGNATLDTALHTAYTNQATITFEAAIPSPATTTLRSDCRIQHITTNDELGNAATTDLQLTGVGAATWINF